MPDNKRKIIILLGLLLAYINFANGFNKSNISYGLTFQSHTVNQDQRTSLNLNPNGELKFAPGYSLHFELMPEKATQTYGYVFRFIVNDTLSLDFISNFNLQKMNFVISNQQGTLNNLEFTNIGKENQSKWFKIKITFNKQQIKCQINDIEKEIPYSFDNYDHTQILFGANNHPIFYTTDVPPISIRNITIINNKGKTVREWLMLRHNKHDVQDEIVRAHASIKNGIWKVNKHVKWTKETDITVTEVNAQIAYDTIQARVFIATSNFIITYNIIDRSITKIINKKGSPFCSGGSQLIYDYPNNRLISYNIQYPELIIYNFETNEWSPEKKTKKFSPIQQHNRLIIDNQLLLFGGYGAHTYKASIAIHDLDKGQWTIKNLSSSIIPRYLSAMGYIGNDTLLIIGGYGSHSGKQEEFPTNLHDIIKVNYKDMTITKVGQFSSVSTPVTFSNSMVFQDKEQKAYAMAYNNNKFHSTATLAMINLKDCTLETLGDSIPYNFLDRESFCDLFYLKSMSTLYSIFLEKKEPTGTYSIKIYSLAFPALKASEITQPTIITTNKTVKYITLFILLFFAIIVGVIRFIKLKKIKKNQEIIMTTNRLEQQQKLSTEKEKVITLSIDKQQGKNTYISAIHLIGYFQVFDKEGNDITQEFTPIIKQLFLYILLNSTMKGRKVTSQELDETFWLGMSKTDASNTRNVNIRKLRLILDKIGDISIDYKGGYWSMHIGATITCDYNEINKSLKDIQNEEQLRISTLEDILKLASYGTLIPNVNAEWADSFKNDYTKQMIDFMNKMLEHTIVKENDKLMIQIADVLLINDTLDENAMCVKCQILFRIGQKSASKRCYDTFVKEYMLLLNENITLNYEDIIKA